MQQGSQGIGLKPPVQMKQEVEEESFVEIEAGSEKSSEDVQPFLLPVQKSSSEPVQEQPRMKMPMQMKDGAYHKSAGNGAVVQRWIEFDADKKTFKENNNSPKGYLPTKGGHWEKFEAARAESPGYIKYVSQVYNKDAPPAVPAAEFQINSPATEVNDSGLSQYGCSVCVAADFFRMKTSVLLEKMGMSPDSVPQNPTSSAVTAFFESIGISLVGDAPSEIDGTEDLKKAEKSDKDIGNNWDGALAWLGHIVRVQMTSNGLVLWDPQDSIGGTYLVPENNFLLYVFDPSSLFTAPSSVSHAAAATASPSSVAPIAEIKTDARETLGEADMIPSEGIRVVTALTLADRNKWFHVKQNPQGDRIRTGEFVYIDASGFYFFREANGDEFGTRNGHVQEV